MKNKLIITGFSILFLYLLLCVLVFFNQKSLVFFPSRNIENTPRYKNLQEVYFITEDNIKLNGWFLDNHSDKTALFFHGNGGNITYNADRLAIFNTLKVNALMFDYRGYGKSEGGVSAEDSLYKDATAAYQFLLNRKITPSSIIIW